VAAQKVGLAGLCGECCKIRNKNQEKQKRAGETLYIHSEIERKTEDGMANGLLDEAFFRWVIRWGTG